MALLKSARRKILSEEDAILINREAVMLPPRREELEILSVEDNQADVSLLEELFSHCSAPVHLSFVGDGEQAMHFLLKRPPYEGAATPHLILLDLNLPRMDGKETLRALKKHPELKRIPTIILTTSNAEQDIQACYELQANCYFIKPQELSEYRRLAESIIEAWFHWASLPTNPNRATEDL